MLGAEAHSTIFIALLGLGKDRLEWMPVDGQECIDLAQLPDLEGNHIINLSTPEASKLAMCT
jgi:hypothetical protein